MKPTSTFKMKSTTKTMLTMRGYRDKQDRDAWKKAMVQAQLEGEERSKKADK